MAEPDGSVLPGDTHYLGLTALVTVALQLSFFAIAFALRFDKVRIVRNRAPHTLARKRLQFSGLSATLWLGIGYTGWTKQPEQLRSHLSHVCDSACGTACPRDTAMKEMIEEWQQSVSAFLLLAPRMSFRSSCSFGKGTRRDNWRKIKTAIQPHRYMCNVQRQRDKSCHSCQLTRVPCALSGCLSLHPLALWLHPFLSMVLSLLLFFSLTLLRVSFLFSFVLRPFILSLSLLSFSLFPSFLFPLSSLSLISHS